MMDLKQIKLHYSKMDNAKLERIAKFEINSIQPEVRPIIIAEIKKRGLDENLLAGIEAQTKEITDENLLELIDKIIGLDCPNCGKSNSGLTGGIIRKVRSYLVLTQYEKKTMIACPSCLAGERKKQLIKNSILGWWGIPWGLFFRTPQAIINHFLDNRKYQEISESILRDFATQNIGELKTNWENEDELIEFIRHCNNVSV
jgi:hypothetical protein